MKQHLTVSLVAILLGLGVGDAARADSRWSLEFDSPLWTCLLRCAGVHPTDDMATCLEACGREHDPEPPSAEESAARLRCEASLMRTEAAQLSCHARCMSASDEPGFDLAACTDSCDRGCAHKKALLLGTTRCKALRAQ
jgi:hypothetical protein